MRINIYEKNLSKKIKKKMFLEYDENGTGKMEIEEIIIIFNINNFYVS
jgi:Ca2+-binding EF-hand superfamily protein